MKLSASNIFQHTVLTNKCGRLQKGSSVQRLEKIFLSTSLEYIIRVGNNKRQEPEFKTHSEEAWNKDAWMQAKAGSTIPSSIKSLVDLDMPISSRCWVTCIQITYARSGST